MTVRIFATHGYSAYSRGCRCQVCRTAKADYMRARRANARQLVQEFTEANMRGRLIVDNIRHGTRYAYEERGCRCNLCTYQRSKSDKQYKGAS